MKIINSKKKYYSPKVEVFIDKKDNKYNGFVGFDKLYNSEVYIDTRDGNGYNTVIKKLNQLQCKIALKSH